MRLDRLWARTHLRTCAPAHLLKRGNPLTSSVNENHLKGFQPRFQPRFELSAATFKIRATASRTLQRSKVFPLLPRDLSETSLRLTAAAVDSGTRCSQFPGAFRNPAGNGPKGCVKGAYSRLGRVGGGEKKCECHFKSRLRKSEIASKASDLRTESQE